MREWWRTPGSSVPAMPRDVRAGVASALRVFGSAVNRVRIDGPDGEVFEAARPGVCARCGAPAVGREARDNRSLVERSTALERGADVESSRPWRRCRRRDCWTREVRAVLAIGVFAARLHRTELELPWAAGRRPMARMTDAEWVAMVAENMRRMR